MVLLSTHPLLRRFAPLLSCFLVPSLCFVALLQVLAERIGSIQSQSVAKTGKLLVDPWLRVQGLPTESFGSILAMGDASLISEINKKEGVLPQTAQVAAQQGAYVARLFNRR